MDNFVDLVDFSLFFCRKMTQTFILSTKDSCKLSFMVLDQSMEEIHLTVKINSLTVPNMDLKDPEKNET